MPLIIDGRNLKQKFKNSTKILLLERHTNFFYFNDMDKDTVRDFTKLNKQIKLIVFFHIDNVAISKYETTEWEQSVFFELESLRACFL